MKQLLGISYEYFVAYGPMGPLVLCPMGHYAPFLPFWALLAEIWVLLSPCEVLCKCNSWGIARYVHMEQMDEPVKVEGYLDIWISNMPRPGMQVSS